MTKPEHNRKPTDADAREHQLGALGQLARSAFSAEDSELAHAAGKRRLRAALADHDPQPNHGARGDRGAHRAPARRWVPATAAALATMIAVAFVIVLRVSGEPAPLSFEVDGSETQGAYLQPPLTGPQTSVAFSDGTTVQLAPGGRARVATTEASGAQLVLEDGHLALQVRHLPGARWSVDAGPYRIAVTGTRFSADWQADAERLHVVVTEGSVMVNAPGRSDGLSVTAGHRLVATAQDGRFELSPLAARGAASDLGAPSAPPNNAAPTSPTQAPAASPVTPVHPPLTPPTSEETWSTQVAAGDFAKVVTAARAQGVAKVTARAPLADLVALGDAARYTGQTAVAQSALEAQRSRFPASSEARTAAFLLGRIAEDQLHAPAAALSWYNTYLNSSPNGAFAAEALGRKLVLLERTSGNVAARDTAKRYLERYPDGPYARAARQVLSAR